MEKIQRVSVKGIICNDNKILLLKDHKGVWEMPGGRVDFGENPKNTLRREISEELGTREAEVGNIVNAWDFSVAHEDKHYHFILIVFECVVDLDKINISKEHVEASWFLAEDVSRLNMREGYKESIKMFMKLKKI